MTDNNEISLIEIVKIFREKFLKISSFSFLIVIFLLIFFFLQKDIYTSKTVLVNPENIGGSSNSSLEKLGGIAGFDVGGTDKLAYVQELIKSRHFVSILVANEDFKRDIFASKSYDKNSKIIKYDSTIYDANKNYWLIKNNDGLAGPSLDRIYRKYLKIVNTSLDITTDMLTVSVDHVSPYAAQEILVGIVENINNLERQRDLTLSLKKINDLKVEIASTREMEVRDAVSNVFQTELASYLVAKNQTDYVVRELDPPFFPEKKSYPLMIPIFILSLVLSYTVIGFFIVFKEIYVRQAGS